MRLEDIKKSDAKPENAASQQGFLSKIFSWFFGVIFLMAALGSLLDGAKGFIPGFFMACMGILLLPPFNRFLNKNGIRITKGAKAGIFLILLFSMSFFISKDKTSSGEADASTQSEETRAVASVEKIQESCNQVSNLFDAQSNLSDLQKEEIWKVKYDGKQFEWPLKVVEVSAGMFGGLTVQFKCQNSRSFVQDIQLSYPKEAKSTIMQFQKGGVYKVKGILKMQSTLLGLSGEASL